MRHQERKPKTTILKNGPKPPAPQKRKGAITEGKIVVPAASKVTDFTGKAERLLRLYKNDTATPMPADLKPMLAKIVDQPFDDSSWLYEIKWDGYRALAYTGEGKVELRSRNNLSFNDKFPPVAAAFADWNVSAVLDGEIVILDETGKADFGALQEWSATGQGQLRYYVFDLLWIAGIDLRNKPLTERKALLKQILPDNGIIRYSDDVEECGKDFFQMAKISGLEGIVAKRKDSHYGAGQRSPHWLKIKIESRQEAVICGYTKKLGTDRLFSSLIMGVPDGAGYRYLGQVGTGFSKKVQLDLLQQMVPLVTERSPFLKNPPVNDPAVWLRPKLIAEVKYTELTKEGVMRHPSFQGLRTDKTAAEYNADLPASHQKQLVVAGEGMAQVDVAGHSLKLTNTDKLFWIKESITKGDLLNYYHAIAPYLMPYLKNRPQSLHRFPQGIEEKSFYQKNMAGRLEPWVQTFRRISESSLLPNHFMVCADEAHLLYMINLGCIELNPWHSTIHTPHKPTWCVVDLDPGNIPFTKVVETALVVKEVLDSLQLLSFPKTSGSTGLHIYIPLGHRHTYDQSRQLAELVAQLVHRQLPRTTSLERSPAKRIDKIYLDYLQNRPIQTICSPYSVRPKRGATASAPLHWSEVNAKLRIEQFTLKNMLERVKREGDLFAGVLGDRNSLGKALQQLAKTVKG